MFCSNKCRSLDSNRKHQSYEAQQERGINRKKFFIDLMGGGCQNCGYNRCIAALEFHHRDPEDKLFLLDIRSLSNRTFDKCIAEVKKCDLLCANCHRERHNAV